MKNYPVFILSVILMFIGHTSMAQDVRASDYQAIPLVVNPAQAGNFDGVLRLTSYREIVSSSTVKNNYTNFSADANIGMNRQWAIGMNYFTSGQDNFQVSNKVLSFSLARKFFFDSFEVSTLRVGAQLSYNQGNLDENKGIYSLDADAGVLRIPSAGNRPVGLPPQVSSMKYLNLAVGAIYKYEQGDVKFETGAAFSNLTQPKNSPFFANAGRRLRAAVHNTFSYSLNDQFTLNFNYFIWQERLFLAGYNPALQDDNAPIKEDMIGLGADIYTRNDKISYEIAERSFKSVIANVGYQFRENLKLNILYEHPLNAKYYDLKHLAFGLKVYLGDGF
ncbi:MAG: type IX secretion system membrane protein PorP/SprF [Sphingobacteriaceae bacterium]